MNLTDLKKWINNLPESELGNYEAVFRTIKELDNEYWFAYDIPIVAVGIDENNKELYLCDEESHKIISKHEKQ